eukprot:TRINITY_DN479_c0_g1_i1.p1 TRINITY_DN479_c0_g1~~TRINITY_DN479_c0_g1_i1.p1  ORF type:complete len:260 (-),score=11.06 TRINITY_DN479_c0_g1_i1:134-913(-)
MSTWSRCLLLLSLLPPHAGLRNSSCPESKPSALKPSEDELGLVTPRSLEVAATNASLAEVATQETSFSPAGRVKTREDEKACFQVVTKDKKCAGEEGTPHFINCGSFMVPSAEHCFATPPECFFERFDHVCCGVPPGGGCVFSWVFWATIFVVAVGVLYALFSMFCSHHLPRFDEPAEEDRHEEPADLPKSHKDKRVPFTKAVSSARSFSVSSNAPMATKSMASTTGSHAPMATKSMASTRGSNAPPMATKSIAFTRGV